MKKITVFLLVAFAFVLIAILSLDIRYDRHNGGHLLKAQSVSTLNPQEYAQHFLQKSEKDIVFVENLGQIKDTEGKDRPDILFLTRSEGVDMYMTNSGISYVFRNEESDYYRLDMGFVGMNKDIVIKKELVVDQQYNYYTPEYPDGISPKAYKKVIMENLYEGIDLVYYEKEGRMKYDFILKAGADAGEIKMKYKGASSMNIDNNGNVIITTPMGEIREGKPYTYSRNTGSKVESRYRVKNNTVLFDIAGYDDNEEIIIDPFRFWATYYGGSGNEGEPGMVSADIYTDNSGNLYVTGSTTSSDFPTQTLTGAYNQATNGGNRDVFILKFNSSGARIWATYYGGSGGDGGLGIRTDNSGNLYVTGRTASSDFPTQTLTGAYNQTTHTGGYDDAFILKFNSSGERIWATFYGGSSEDRATRIIMDNSGNLYVTGWTQSSNFPTQTLTGAYNQTTFGGNRDVFILKFNSSGVRIWATYYGGSGDDRAHENSICTDNSGNLYVTGWTESNNFPTQTLTGAYNQTTHSGNRDGFMLKFNSSGVRIWATYYGGTANDVGIGICTDTSGYLYVAGRTESSDFPTQILTGAYNQTTHGGDFDAFILKFNSSGARIWATYYGGSGEDRGRSICIDISANLYLVGLTQSSDFPTQTLTGAYNQTANGGDNDAFILKFNSSGERIWATYYGGSGDERANSICTDNPDNLYVAGRTESSDFPIQILTGAYNQTTHGGGNDAFILRFYEFYAAFTASDDTICEGEAVSFTDQSSDNVISWDWTFEGGTPGTSTVQNPSVTYNTMGTYDVQLIVSDGTYPDTLLEEDYINVSNYLAQPNAPSGPAETCEGGSYDYITDPVTGTTSYEWMVEPSDAGTISGSGTIGTYMAVTGWTGAYSVKVRASNYCGLSAWSDTLAANLNHQPLIFYLTGDGHYCEGEPGAEVMLDGSETGVDYELYFEGVATGNIVAGTGSAISFGYLTTVGLYTAVGYTDYCSENMIGQVYVFVQPIPGQPDNPSGPDMVCGSDTTEYTTDNPSNADTLIWILDPSDAGTMIPGEQMVEIIWSTDFSGAAFLSVYGTNACGDGPPSDEFEITVLMVPAPEISGLTSVDPGSTEDYMTAENPGNTYEWEVSGGTIVSGAGTFQVSVLWGESGSGYVMVTEDNGTCSTTTEPYGVDIGPVAIGENDLQNFKVYPNAATNVLNIDLGTIRKLKDGMISLINIQGNVIYSAKATEGLKNIRINISGYAPGLYYVQIVEDDRIIGARKVVIVR